MTVPNPAWNVVYELKPGEEVDIKDWMVKAIADGHYTPDQIQFIKYQRQNVHNTIAELEKAHTGSLCDKTVSPPTMTADDVIALPTVNPHPVFHHFIANESEPIHDEHPAELQTLLPLRYDPNKEHDEQLSESQSPTSFLDNDRSQLSPYDGAAQSVPTPCLESIKEPIILNPPPQIPATKMFPVCNFRACVNCRPTWRDRAWASIEDTMVPFPPFPPKHEIQNRRLSKASVVAKLGTRQPYPPRYLRSWSDLGMVASYHSPTDFLTRQNSNWNSIDSSETDDIDEAEERARGSLRASLKRAFKNVMSVHKRDTSRNTSRTNSNSKRSGKMRRREQDAEDGDIGFGFDVDTRKNSGTQIDPILTMAALTELPESDGRTENTEVEHDFHVGELEVGDGVAVTEEAVEMGEADIIMQP
jgi:hypothetical protein